MEEEKKKHPIGKFEWMFFAISAVIILILGLRLGILTPLNAIATFFLVATAPFLFRYIDKRHGEEKKFQSKLDKIDTMTEKELANRIASIYTNRGFAIESYDSPHPGVHLVCQRKGVRNGENFIERGLVVVIHTTEVIDFSAYLTFEKEIKEQNATQGMMVTNSRFSPEIKDHAGNAKIALWDRKELREKFHL